MGIDEISIPTTEIEADGFITPPSALERKTERTQNQHIQSVESVGADRKTEQTEREGE